jgi:hypothetical protein
MNVLKIASVFLLVIFCLVPSANSKNGSGPSQRACYSSYEGVCLFGGCVTSWFCEEDGHCRKQDMKNRKDPGKCYDCCVKKNTVAI